MSTKSHRDAPREMRVVIVGYSWDWLFQRPQQLAIALSRTSRVTYYSETLFWGRVVWGALKTRTGNRARVSRLVGPGLAVVVSPKWLPYRIATRLPDLDLLTNRLQLGLLRVTGVSQRPDAAILASASPWDEMMWEKMPARVKVYDCFDEHALFAPAGSARQQELRQAEERALAHADLVLVTSAQLLERLRRRHRRVVMVPNGVDMRHFEAAETPGIPELSELNGPVLGYVGGIEHWVDIELIAKVAELLPDYTIVMVGPELCNVSALKSCPNVRFLGRQPYAWVPALMRGFDVAMIPFRDNELTRAVDPVKFYEYCAAGKPVVSTPLPTMQERSDLVYIARGPEEFARQVRRARAEDGPELQQRRRELARANSWDSRAQVIFTEIRKLLPAARQSEVRAECAS